jgi:short subunit dehydrogenase-like uncharacterized protein
VSEREQALPKRFGSQPSRFGYPDQSITVFTFSDVVLRITAMSAQTDLLILGATGHTGRLITRYLSAHPQRSAFRFAVGARSPAKLQTLLEELNLQNDADICIVQVDVTKTSEVEKAVKSTRVVINTVGPFWKWGTPVVAACAKHGVHYVDLTGETVWIRHIIQKYDFCPKVLYFSTLMGLK